MTRIEPLFDRQQAPTTWTIHHVKMRLVEAYETERKIPERRINGGGSNWPPILHEWTDYVHWNLPGDDTRAREWNRWERTNVAFGFEISRMEEALLWLQILAPYREEQERLEIWAKVSALNRSIRRELKKRQMSHATFYRYVTSGAMRIAAELNRRGVAVR